MKLDLAKLFELHDLWKKSLIAIFVLSAILFTPILEIRYFVWATLGLGVAVGLILRLRNSSSLTSPRDLLGPVNSMTIQSNRK